MKKIISIVFSIFLVLCVIFIDYGNVKSDEIDIYDYDEISNFMKKNKLTNTFSNKSFNKEKTFEYDEYKDDYAGSYVKDGKLIILKTNSNKMPSTLKLNNSNQEKIVKFSMNQLNETMNDINLYKKYNGDTHIARQFNFYWIDIENNRIVVEFDELSDNNIELFKENVSDNECITFKQIQSKPKEEVNAYPGSKIVIGSGGSSIGYRATKNGVKGLVISGHAGNVGNNVYLNGTLIGTVESKKNSGNVDAAFVKTNNSVNLSNTVNSSTLSNNVQNLNVGVDVMKKGFSTGTTTGKVTKSNVSVTFNGVSFFGLVGANYNSQNGDSGGLVYFKVPGENLLNTVGIHKGTAGDTKIYSKASEINKSLNLRRY